MPYALIPEGFTLKKVTKAQQDAIDEYFGRERRGGYLNTLIENPATTTLVGGALTGGALLALINKFFSEGGPFTKEEIVEKLNPLAVIETAIETTSPTVDITASLETLTSALSEREQNK